MERKKERRKKKERKKDRKRKKERKIKKDRKKKERKKKERNITHLNNLQNYNLEVFNNFLQLIFGIKNSSLIKSLKVLLTLNVFIYCTF